MPRGAATLTRRAAVAAMAAAGVGYIALYSPRRDPRERGRVVLDYWEKWTGQEADAMRTIVDRFNDAQDRIFVRYFSVSAIMEKALVAIAGGSPPDIVGLWNDKLPVFLDSGAILPLDALASEFGHDIEQALARHAEPVELQPDRYAPAVWAMMTYGGRIGGAVNTCSTLALYYSRKAFRDAGLDPNRPPRTIAELDDFNARLTSFDSRGVLQRAGFIHSEPGWWKWIWGSCFGGRICDAQARRAECDSPENIRAYEWAQETSQRLGPSALTQFQSGFGGYNSIEQPILAGRVAMILQGPFVANVFHAFAPDFEYGAAPFPVVEPLVDDDNPVGMIESDMLCIPRGARHPREALEFILYTQRQEVAEFLARAHAKPSPLAETSPAFAATHPNHAIAVHERLVRSSRAFTKPLTRAWPRIEGEFNAMWGPMWELQVPAAEGLRAIQVRAQAHLDAEADRRRRRAEGDA